MKYKYPVKRKDRREYYYPILIDGIYYAAIDKENLENLDYHRVIFTDILHKRLPLGTELEHAQNWCRTKNEIDYLT